MAMAQARKSELQAEAKGRNIKVWVTLGTGLLLCCISPGQTIITIVLFLLLSGMLLVRYVFIKLLPGADNLGDYLVKKLLKYFWGWYALFWLLWLLLGAVLSHHD